jgi:hypothetical protein
MWRNVSCKNRRFRGTYRLHIKGEKTSEPVTTLTVTGVFLLLDTANVPNLSIPASLVMEAICSSETSVLTRATRRNIPEYGIPKNYIVPTFLENYISLYLKINNTSFLS